MQVRRQRRAEDRRRDDRAERCRHVTQLDEEPATSLACVEVLIDHRPLALRKPIANVRAELASGVATCRWRLVLQVRLKVGLAQSLARPIRQRGNGVRSQAEHRSDLRRGLALHFGVPQHQLPTLRQRSECDGDQRPILRSDERVGERGALVVGDLGPQLDGQEPSLRCAGPVVVRVADAGQEVGPERDLRPAAATDGAEDAREAFRHEVVGLRAVADQVAGRGMGGGDVTLVELGVRRVVAGARPKDQLGIAAS